MSICIGNLINETLNDNRLKINTYNNSNIINLNIEGTTYNDAIINFKNLCDVGVSNNFFVINSSRSNIFNANRYNSTFTNDLYIKSNFYTSNDYTYINSNMLIKLTSNTNNNFSIINSNNNVIFRATNSNLKINFNNSNKLTISNNEITFNDNITINSNYSLIVSNIKSSSPTIPILIDNATFKNLNITGYNVKNIITIDNDTLYPNQSMLINRYYIDCNILDIYNKYITSNSNNSNDSIETIITSNRVFSINKNGFIGIGTYSAQYPIDINISSALTSNSNNYPFIFNYYNSNKATCNVDIFNITNRGYVGIGTNITNNQLAININDDNRNIINYPAINLNLNYDRNSNYRTSNIIDLTFIASTETVPIYNNEDMYIGSNSYQYDNFNFTINNNSNLNPATEIDNASIIVNVINTVNNDYITINNISNIVPYSTYNYPAYSFTNNNINYFINYGFKYPSFLKVDEYDILVADTRINPSLSQDATNLNHYNITYTTYIIKNETVKPYDETNLILKETRKLVYILEETNINSFSIYLIQRLYIEKSIYQLKSFVDSLTYIYQKPPDLLYATSNNNFVASLSAEGKLALGDKSPQNDYYLYINKKARIDNLECLNISSISNKKNVTFSFCNISNINKAFINSNITSNLIVQTATINHSIIDNINSSNINVSNININNLNYTTINGCNLIITSNLFNPNIKIVVGTNNNNNDNYFMNINVNSNYSNGLCVQSFNSNIHPSLAIVSYTSNSYPVIILSNMESKYSMNINNNNNFNLYDNKNNRLIYRHVNYNDNINNQFIFGSNNIIFDLRKEVIPTNATNKISLGYPYRYLMQNSMNTNNWEIYAKDNTLNSDCMLNVYGNINLSTINNTPFMKCVATDYPNETVSVNIAGAVSRENTVFNVQGNSYFSSNINVNNDIFVKGTVGNVSDIRVKENLIKIKNSLKKITQINGYIYTRKDTGKIETGLVAQEVLKILPEAVNMNTDNDYYNISYGNMMGLIVEGIKELNNKLNLIEDYIYNEK